MAISHGRLVKRRHLGPPGSPAREGVAVGDGLVFVGLTRRESDRASRGNRASWSGKPSLRRSGARAVRRRFGCALVRRWIGIRRHRMRTTDTEARLSLSMRRLGTRHGASLSCPLRENRDPTLGRRTMTRGNTAAALSGWSERTDPELGLVFYATGNAVPQYGGENRPGDNLYTDCVVALDSQDRQASLALPDGPP